MAHRRTIETRAERTDNNALLPTFINYVVRVSEDCVRLANSDKIPEETVDYCITRLEALERSLIRSAGSLLDKESAESFLSEVRSLLAQFRNHQPQASGPSTSCVVHSGAPCGGRPRFSISKNQLDFLIHCGFTVQRMAELLGCSSSTVKRRMRDYTLTTLVFASFTDQELDDLVSSVITKNRRLGPNAVKARILGMGHNVQRQRVRDSMARVDPAGCAVRTAVCIKRRGYSVAGPNSVWHIDGNHKLIRWKIVIHGGIDGYSRLMVFLRASNNNRSETVLEHFIMATDVYNVPSRICVDYGGENNAVSSVMNLVRGQEHRAVIRCKSVHNQRIERAWVDVWNGATNLFYDVFSFMEKKGLLDVENETHLWALHYVYIPRVNAELDLFRQQWNRHGLRTKHHESPIQLFVGGSLELSNSSLTAMKDIFASGPEKAHTLFNREGWSLNSNDQDGATAVEVSTVPCPLTESDFAKLKSTVDPLEATPDIGITLYTETLDFISKCN